MKSILLVFIGGGTGSICRYALSRWLNPSVQQLPLGTLASNVISSFILGLLLAFVMLKGKDSPWVPLIAVGFCGGFSTFSTFSSETYNMFQSGNYYPALLYTGASLILCLIAVGLGLKIFSFIN